MVPVLIAALAFQGTPVKSVVYIPDAKFQIVYPFPLVPRPLDAQTIQSRKSREGGTTFRYWEVEVPVGFCFLSYTSFTPAEPAKQTNRQRAETLFTLSKDMADSMETISKDGEWKKRHEQKFVNRKVTERKIGPYTAVVDAHDDLLSKSTRRSVAWGDDKEQWFLELSLDTDRESMKTVIDQIVDSIAVMKLTGPQAKDLPVYEQELPKMDMKISAPGVFGMFHRPAISSSRPGGLGTVAHLSMADGYNVSIYHDKYTDQDKANTESVANKLLEGMKLPGLEVKASKVQPHKVGSLTGHALRVDYVENGRAMYGISAALTKPGLDVILHIQISKEAGGKEEADTLFNSLKEK